MVKRWIAGAVLVLFATTSGAQPATGPSTLGELFRVHSGRELAALNARGVFLRQFDLVDVAETTKKLQVALVIDGTESMGQDISTAIGRLGDFVLGLQSRRPAGSQIELALVVYRDVEAKSGAVSMGTPKFVADLGQLQDALKLVETEPGEPYFEEAVDAGVHAALTRLDWAPRTDDLGASRWMLVCGDAPPYPDDKKEYRKFSTSSLVEMANEKGIHVSTVLCGAGFLDPSRGDDALKKTYQEKLPRTREFMKALSDGSGGKFFDLADMAFVQTLTDAIKQSGQRYQSIDPILASDVDATRQKALAQGQNAGLPLRFAVMPHAARTMLRAQDDSIGTQIAVEMRQKMSLAPRVTLRRLDEVQGTLKGLDLGAFKTDEELVRKVSEDLAVDYLLWGEATEDKDKVSLSGRVFRADGRLVARTDKTVSGSQDAAVTGLAGSVLEKLMFLASEELPKLEGVDPREVITFAAIGSRDVSKQMVAKLANDVRALRYLTSGMNLLEKATSQKMGSPESKGFLDKATTTFVAALEHEPGNAFAQLQLASCYFNLARYEENGTAAQTEKLAEMRRAIGKAHAARESYPVALVKTEIEADHALLGKDPPDVPEAIRLYESILTQVGSGPNEFARRAHWVLAGIRLGDWGVESISAASVDTARAREHILQILALWPDSPEARFYAPYVNMKVSPQIPLLAAMLDPSRKGG